MESTEQPTIQPLTAVAREAEDLQLVALVRRKDRKATAEFINRCADPIYRYLASRLSPRTDLVDDLLQEVFLAAWKGLDEYRGESPLRAWLISRRCPAGTIS